MIKVNLITKEVTREELPQFLQGLAQESLNDLSWCDEALGLKGFGYWEEVDMSQDISDTTAYDDTEVLHVNIDLKIVEVIKGLRLKTEAELTAERKAKVPNSITMRQARLILLKNGLLNNVDTAINAMPSPQKEAAQIEWQYGKDILMTSPLIVQLAQALSISDESLDTMFIEAAKL